MTITMRQRCRCGETQGTIETRNGQDCVYCSRCGQYAGYNAPKTETGRAPRTLQTVRNISPSQRSRIIQRAQSRCELCGTSPGGHIGHVLSVKDGFDFLTDIQLNSDENLMWLCAECNLGLGEQTLPIWLFAAILKRRT